MDGHALESAHFTVKPAMDATRVEELQAELASVRTAAKKRESELSALVANAKEIFELNLSIESDRITKRCADTIDSKDNELAAQRRLLTAKEEIIADLAAKVASAEQDKLLALRDQRRAALLQSELSESDLAQSRAVAERSRYLNEKELLQRDQQLAAAHQRAEDLQRTLLGFWGVAHSSLAEAEVVCRSALIAAEADAFAALEGFRSWIAETDVYRDMCEQILLRRVREGLRVCIQELDGCTIEVQPIAGRLSSQCVIDEISHLATAHSNRISHELSIALSTSEKQEDEIRSVQAQCASLQGIFESFVERVDSSIIAQDTAIDRVSEMQTRLGLRISRENAKSTVSTTAIDSLSAVYEEEIQTLKQKIFSQQEDAAAMFPASVVEDLKAQLSVSNQALALLRDKIAEGTVPTLDVVPVGPSGGVRRNSEHSSFSEAPFDRWDEASAGVFGSAQGKREGARGTGKVPAESAGADFSDAAHRGLLDEVATLRRELRASKSNIVDLKALIKRLRERKECAAPTDASHGESTPVAVEELHHAPTNNLSAKPDVPTGADPSAGDAELQMQVFTLRRERDAWKRKADAALAQASHAEEQRLASVHTYLQLVGRKEEEYAHHILSGAPTTGLRPRSQLVPSSGDSLMPGGVAQSGLDPTALEGVLQDVRSRGEERADRWLSVRADELKLQSAQLNAMRDELAMKASSLARREEALQHEKIGLALKKGAPGRSGGLAGLLMPRRDDESHQQPLREAVPATRLRPVMQAALPQSDSKPLHPQRFVLAPLHPK